MSNRRSERLLAITQKQFDDNVIEVEERTHRNSLIVSHFLSGLPNSGIIQDFEFDQSFSCNSFPKFKLINKNIYPPHLRKPMISHDVPLCTCDSGYGCSKYCTNRLLFMECNLGLCPQQITIGVSRFKGCGNTAIQERCFPNIGVKHALGRGHGLFAFEDIDCGTIIGEYTGEVLSRDECNARMCLYEDNSDFYFAALVNGLVLDAKYCGSLVRFANHSCSPNCSLQKWEVNGEYRLALVANRNITFQEELSYNYNYFDDGFDGLFNFCRQICKCGSVDCCGTIGGRVVKSESSKWLEKYNVMICGTRKSLQNFIDHALDFQRIRDIAPANVATVFWSLSDVIEKCEMLDERISTLLSNDYNHCSVSCKFVFTICNEYPTYVNSFNFNRLLKLYESCVKINESIGSAFKKTNLEWTAICGQLSRIGQVLPVIPDNLCLIVDYLIPSVSEYLNLFPRKYLANCITSVNLNSEISMYSKIFENHPIFTEFFRIWICLDAAQNLYTMKSSAKRSYCFCKHISGIDDQSLLICCDVCKLWYHPECVGMSADTFQRDEMFFCPICITQNSLYQNSYSLTNCKYPKNFLEVNEFLAFCRDANKLSGCGITPFLTLCQTIRNAVEDWMIRVDSFLTETDSKYLLLFSISSHDNCEACFDNINSLLLAESLRKSYYLYYELMPLSIYCSQRDRSLRKLVWLSLTISVCFCNHRPLLADLINFRELGHNLGVDGDSTIMIELNSRILATVEFHKQLNSEDLLENFQNATVCAKLLNHCRQFVHIPRNYKIARLECYMIHQSEKLQNVYCVCSGSDDGSPMVCCDKCDIWFHCACVGIENFKNLKKCEQFFCISCCIQMQCQYPYFPVD